MAAIIHLKTTADICYTLLYTVILFMMYGAEEFDICGWQASSSVSDTT